MSVFDYTAAIFLASIGIGLIIFFCSVLAYPLSSWLRNIRLHSKLKHLTSKLGHIDSLIEDKKLKEALAELKRLATSHLSLDAKESSGKLKEHNQNILSRCVLVSEELGKHSPHLSELEALLIERIELLELSAKVNSTRSKLLQKRSKSGKDLPKWTETEFKQKAEDVKQEIKENLRALEITFDRFTSSLLSGSTDENITYH